MTCSSTFWRPWVRRTMRLSPSSAVRASTPSRRPISNAGENAGSTNPMHERRTRRERSAASGDGNLSSAGSCAATNDPFPMIRSTTPSRFSVCKAFLEVMRLTPKRCASSISDGTRSPMLSLPARISSST